MQKTVLLTGASSFLGMRLSHFFSGLDYTLIKTAAHNDGEHSILSMNLMNRKEVESVIAETKPDIVIHAGAVVNLERDYKVGETCLLVNALGTYTLLDALSASSLQRFIYISTEEVYGDGPIPFLESQAIAPPSPYAVSKSAGEFYTAFMSKNYGFDAVILRLGTLYGPQQPAQKYFYQVIQEALQHKEICTNSAAKKRDYLYIDDAVSCVIASIQSQLKGCEIINAAGGQSYSLDTVLQTIIRLAQSRSTIRYGCIPERRTERDEWLADIQKAKKFLNWKPEVSLEVGLQRMIEYVKLQQHL